MSEWFRKPLVGWTPPGGTYEEREAQRKQWIAEFEEQQRAAAEASAAAAVLAVAAAAAAAEAAANNAVELVPARARVRRRRRGRPMGKLVQRALRMRMRKHPVPWPTIFVKLGVVGTAERLKLKRNVWEARRRLCTGAPCGDIRGKALKLPVRAAS